MDYKHFDPEALKVISPDERLKVVTRSAANVEIDVNIPPRRYFRSGVEMVRMANVYMDEGSLENAYILFLKFMTLFLEKIRAHPEYDTVPAAVKAINTQKLREVLPKAEKIKKELLAHYKSEYEKYIVYQKRIEQEERGRWKAEEEKRQIEGIRKNLITTSINDNLEERVKQSQKASVFPVPPLLQDLTYPDLISANNDASSSKGVPPSQSGVSPGIDRSTKPGQSLIAEPSSSIERGLRTVCIPENLVQKFLSIARWNTDRNIETCGILAGKLRHNELVITHLLVPEQSGTSDSCTTQREEDIFDFQDQHDLITIGWIHTHPSQTAFLSSVDLHTHYSYQKMMPEAIAIVSAPKYKQSKSFCLTPDYGLSFIGSCQKPGFHPHPPQPILFMEAEHSVFMAGTSVELVDLRR